MFLKNLEICDGKKIIRSIPFHKGINLIIDETSGDKKTDSGNSVGKTTILRLIDFCLDGSGNNIYIDPEFKNHNTKVEQFLKENNVIIRLTLITDIDDELSEKIIIERNFLARTDKILRINGDDYTSKDFSIRLKELIFHSDSEKPSFKQLKSKNIRDEKNKLLNTIRVLAQNVTTDVAYETLHLFWFGIDTNLSKDKLIRDKHLELRIQARLRKGNNLSQITQSLIIVNRKIEELLIKKNTFNINDNYDQDFKHLNIVREKINSTSTIVSRLELRKDLITESKNDLEETKPNIDHIQIMSLYDKAKSLIPNLQKTFEETLAFHEGMISKKIAYLLEELPKLSEEIKNNNKILQEYLEEEKFLSKKLIKSGAIEELQDIVNELNEYYERKGLLEEQKRNWELSNNNIKKIDEDLDKINDEFISKDELIQKRISEFNVFFSDISNRLDGKHSLLSAENLDGVYKFEIGNIDGNPGTGSKKSQMASFDLAYIKFADSIGIPCLHFILQDQIENVHSNQITNLFTEVVSEVKCQYVLPVLRDKLPKDINISSYEIISLSQNDKLFRI